MKLLAILGASAVLSCALYASDNRAAEPTIPKGTPAEQVTALIKQHKQAMAAFRKLFDAAKTEEQQEKLEQLRALEAGLRIDVTIVDTVPRGVDTPADLETARRMLAPHFRSS